MTHNKFYALTLAAILTLAALCAVLIHIDQKHLADRIEEFNAVCTQVAEDIETGNYPHRPDGSVYTAESLLHQISVEYGFNCVDYIESGHIG